MLKLKSNFKESKSLGQRCRICEGALAATGFQLVVAAAGRWLGGQPFWRPTRPLVLTEGVSSRERGKRAGQDGPVLLRPPLHQHQQQQQQQQQQQHEGGGGGRLLQEGGDPLPPPSLSCSCLPWPPGR